VTTTTAEGDQQPAQGRSKEGEQRSASNRSSSVTKSGGGGHGKQVRQQQSGQPHERATTTPNEISSQRKGGARSENKDQQAIAVLVSQSRVGAGRANKCDSNDKGSHTKERQQRKPNEISSQRKG